MYVHDTVRLAYLAHPRTASVATRDALLLGGFRAASGHHTGLPRPGLEPPLEGDWKIFTTVRNPWDTAVSWIYHMNRATPPPARPWPLDLFKNDLGPRNSWITTYGRLFWMLEDADVVLRYESLQDELDKFLTGEGVEPVPLLRANLSAARGGADYRSFYTDETQDFVGELFKSEIEALGYTFEKESS